MKEGGIFDTAHKLAAMFNEWLKKSPPAKKTKTLSYHNDPDIDDVDKQAFERIERHFNTTIKSGSVSVNGIRFRGNNVDICGNRIRIDGKDVTPGNEKNIVIAVEGDIDKLSVDNCQSFNMTGSAGSVKTMSGDVTCGDISGSVDTMSGDVYASNIAGSVKTMSGNITGA